MKIFLKWLPVGLGIVVWTAAWWLTWENFLFEQLTVEGGPGSILFPNEQIDQRSLWVGVGTALVLGSIGFLFLIASTVFQQYSRAWSRTWLGLAAVLILIGLSAPIIYPSTESLVVDGGAQVVSLDRNWLYAQTSESLPFDEISRVGLRVRRTLVGGAVRGCRVASGLSIIRYDRTWLEVPNGIDHEAAGVAVAEIADKTLESLGTREC